MPTDHRAVLAKIKRFDQLIAYLRDEMGWPIARDSFEDVDDLFYDFTAGELGIDAKNAAKIQEIKRLRPLSPNQPWGIFFVKFEPKRLPVVALRRILSQVALKKRASANSAERTVWAADDLLFVSNYGEGDERQISFAHFSQDRTKADLPILKVLGWDDRDTALHLDGVATELTTKLSWPEDESSVDRWRGKWRSAFALRPDEAIKTSKALAVELAKLARRIRDRIRTVLAIETENGPVTKLMKAIQGALVHDLDAGGFAAMYAQTIAYGLLSARVTNPKANTADGFAAQLPVTNPFLKELMETFLHVGGRKGKAGRGPGIDFDELGVGEVVDLLDDPNTKMEAVVRDFGRKNPQEDPVIHFYELFAKEYDAKERKLRGIFYTPRPVVSYIVRSVHELLQSEFGLADGLADTATWGEMVKHHTGMSIPEGVKPTDRFVTILDPATGTGTFLVEAIEVIYRTLVEKWNREGHGEKKILDLWKDYVPRHLLPRLHGYELLMAPYAIAHLKIGLKLYETGYRFESDERARIYLTNALEAPQDFSERFDFAIPALAHEAQAVNEIKRRQRFSVVIGNPPYSGLSANLTEQARNLVARFKFIDGVKLNERGALQLEKNLQEDYVKFLSFAEDCLAATAAGVCGIICNHGFIDNPTLRGVRWSLLRNFHRIWILDLHGNVNRREAAPDGSDDQNVFDIKDAGVAICLGAKKPRVEAVDTLLWKSDLWGDRDLVKYPFLLSKTVASQSWETVASEPDLFLFRALSQGGAGEYSTWPKVTAVFPLHSVGMITARDSYVIDFEPEPIVERARAFRDSRLDDEGTCKTLGIPIKKGWNIRRARERIKLVKDLASCIQPLLYRPFDVRPVFYHESLIWGMALPVMQHMRGGKNLALITSRMTKGEAFHHVLVSNSLSEVILLSSKTSNNAFVFPLHIRSEASGLQLGAQGNLSPEFLELLGRKLTSRRTEPGTLPQSISTEGILHYIYAVLNSSGYRTRYAEFLKIDFPRLPLTSSLVLFRELARLGGELVALHLVEAPTQQALSARYDKAARAWRYEVAKGQRLPVKLSFNGPPKSVVDKVGWSDDTVWIDAVKPKKGAADAKVTGAVGFRGVPEAVWNFHIGGYQVCEKWLKDRKDRTLSADDIAHYHRIVIALHETIRLMSEIDKVIDAHGGWPGAFQGGSGAEPGKDRVLKVAEPSSECDPDKGKK